MIYLYEGGQQHAAHFLLQDDLVLRVIVAGADERREEHFDESRVAEILERQLTQFLQNAGLTARLHDHLEHTHATGEAKATGSCKSTHPSRKSATKTTHKQPLRGEIEGTASQRTITLHKTQTGTPHPLLNVRRFRSAPWEDALGRSAK